MAADECDGGIVTFKSNHPKWSYAKIGEDGIPFYVGNNRAPFIVKKKGFLHLGINDYNFKDNSGEFKIKIFY